MARTTADDKAALRAHFRDLRRGLARRPERSDRIWGHVVGLAEYQTARTVMLFDTVPGEPETAQWKVDASTSGRVVYLPEQSPLPDRVDLVVVPGLAFTPNGHRLGQGGGWYDRFLVRVDTAATVGVCFESQLADELPVEPHDVMMTHVVTERGIYGLTRTPS